MNVTKEVESDSVAEGFLGVTMSSSPGYIGEFPSLKPEKLCILATVSDFRIEICQNADTVGSEQPTYFAVAWNLQAKNPTGNLIDRESESIDGLKKAAAEYVDKRRARMDRPSKAES